MLPMLKRHGLFFALTFASAIHLGFVGYKAANPPVLPLTSLEVPTSLPMALGGGPTWMEGMLPLAAGSQAWVRTASLETTAVGSSRCRILVAFDPECPFCDRAAVLDGDREEPLPFPTVWVTRTEMEAEAFRARHPDLEIVVQEGAFLALQVKAVPAAFLLSETEVLKVWRFTGKEEARDLRADCSPNQTVALAEGIPADD